MLRSTPMTSAEANASIKKLSVMRVSDLTTVTSMKLEDFVREFVRVYSLRYPTIYAKTGKVQTAAGKRRSLGDITRICQYYFPGDKHKVSLEKVKNILKDLVNKKEISTDICNETNKRVFFFRSTKSQTIDEVEDRDEFGWKFNLTRHTALPKNFSSAVD